MILTYSGRSRLSAKAIAEEDEDIELHRPGYNIGRIRADINWGCARADTNLNPNISNSTNKRKMRELFREHGVPMPELVEHTVIQHDNQGRFFKPIVGRPDHHMKGRGFWRVHNIRELQRALRGTRRKKAATHFMEFVEADREYRVHIFKGRSIRISEKEFYTDENGKRDYVTIKPNRRVRRVRKAAKQAVEALGLDFGAVDILARGDNNDEVFVLEVNAAPGLGGTMPALYAETFKRWEEGEFDA